MKESINSLISERKLCRLEAKCAASIFIYLICVFIYLSLWDDHFQIISNKIGAVEIKLTEQFNTSYVFLSSNMFDQCRLACLHFFTVFIFGVCMVPCAFLPTPCVVRKTRSLFKSIGASCSIASIAAARFPLVGEEQWQNFCFGFKTIISVRQTCDKDITSLRS